MRLIFIALLFVSISALPVHAANSKSDLQKIEANLKQEQKRKQELAATQEQLETKLDELRGSLLEMTHHIQIHEKAVLKLRDAQADTEKQIDKTKSELDGQRQSLAQTIMAMQRLNRVPPQALLARPSAPIDMARSFDLLQKIIPAVAEQANQVKQSMEELAALRATQQEQETSLLAEKKSLQTKQNKLSGLLTQRQKLLDANNAEQKQAERKMASLAGQAKDIRALLQQIDRQERIAPTPKVIPRSVTKTLKSWFGLGSASKLPVAGNIETGYGEEMAGGGHSQGLRIAATPGAIVTAPSNGTIRFAGPFRQYKLLIIVQHNNGEHSLLGGLQELYTRTGAHVVAGEPLGKLPKLEGDSTRATSLYYERRRNGKPIDPRQARG